MSATSASTGRRGVGGHRVVGRLQRRKLGNASMPGFMKCPARPAIRARSISGVPVR